jgi:hypothetical protein
MVIWPPTFELTYPQAAETFFTLEPRRCLALA